MRKWDVDRRMRGSGHASADHNKPPLPLLVQMSDEDILSNQYQPIWLPQLCFIHPVSQSRIFSIDLKKFMYKQVTLSQQRKYPCLNRDMQICNPLFHYCGNFIWLFPVLIYDLIFPSAPKRNWLTLINAHLVLYNIQW